MRSLEKAIGYAFRNRKLLRTALTHASLAGESDVAHNQRLEFLGDAVLQLVMSERLYAAYPDAMEGDLSRMRARSVNEKALCEAARRLGLGTHLLMSHGEEMSGGRDRPSVLADAMEALLGAVYLDGGIGEARAIAGAWLPIVSESAQRDYKSELQEHMQGERGLTPSYRIASEEGPPHRRIFFAQVYIGDEMIGEGSGTSKKGAEQAAAEAALRAVLKD